MAVLRDHPYGAFNFSVDLGTGSKTGFSEVSGLTQETEVIEYREGSDPVVRKFPGPSRVSNVTLRRGVLGSLELYEWYNQVRNGAQDVKRSVTITLLDEESQPVLRWRLFSAFPVKYEGPTLNVKSNDIAIEELVLCCERIEVE